MDGFNLSLFFSWDKPCSEQSVLLSLEYRKNLVYSCKASSKVLWRYLWYIDRNLFRYNKIQTKFVKKKKKQHGVAYYNHHIWQNPDSTSNKHPSNVKPPIVLPGKKRQTQNIRWTNKQNDTSEINEGWAEPGKILSRDTQEHREHLISPLPAHHDVEEVIWKWSTDGEHIYIQMKTISLVGCLALAFQAGEVYWCT